MNWPSRIVLVRHGESVGNVRSIDDHPYKYGANHQYVLTPRGREQAAITGTYLRETYGAFDAYFASTLARTQETFSLMYPETQPIIDSRLNELSRGIWNRMSRAEIERCYPGEANLWESEGWYHYRPPGGQSCPDGELAIHSFTAFLREQYAGKNVLITGHGTWLILFWRTILNRQVAEAEHRRRANQYKNASVTIYEGRGQDLVLAKDNFVPWA